MSEDTTNVPTFPVVENVEVIANDTVAIPEVAVESVPEIVAETSTETVADVVVTEEAPVVTSTETPLAM